METHLMGTIKVLAKEIRRLSSQESGCAKIVSLADLIIESIDAEKLTQRIYDTTPILKNSDVGREL